MLEKVVSYRAPAAVGAYSQAIKANGFIFCSGQIPCNPETGEIITGPVAGQTRQVMDNLKAVLDAANSDFAHVVKVTVLLSDITTFAEMNGVYAEYFDGVYPARIAFEVGGLYGGVGIEVDVVAVEKR
jgi:2-iminobutanoate/2-iminopropanoate deaminase